MIAYKFLAEGAVAPFTAFHWPPPGQWVNAPANDVTVWVHACRPRDLPYWLDDELWSLELAGPIEETRYQIASPRARLVARVTAWDGALGWEYARACALRARDLALPQLPPPLRGALASAKDLEAVSEAGRAEPGSRAAAFVADAADNARLIGPQTTSYIACTLAAWLGGGLAAFEAERGWQAAWLAARLGLERA